MSTGFLGEAGRSGRRLRGKPREFKPTAIAPPRARSKQTVRPKRELPRPDLTQLVTDLRSGISRLGRLAQKLSLKDSRARAPRPTVDRRVPQDVTKIIERELRTLSQLAPADVKHEITREYRELADRAMRLQVPQAHAALLQAERRVPPAEALRPRSKAVRSLMRAAQAIKQGRLPFLPKETRREAQKLLNVLFGKREAAQIARSGQIPKAIESQRLLPTAVHGMIEAARAKNSPVPPLLGLLRRSIESPLASMGAPQRTAAPPVRTTTSRAPVSAQDLPRLARSMPAFDTQGVAASGAFLSHADEDVQVITRSDSPLVAPTEDDGADAGPIPQAPKATSARQPGVDQSAPGAHTAGGVTPAREAASQSKGTMQIEGTMSIPELGDIVGKFTGFMRDNGALT